MRFISDAVSSSRHVPSNGTIGNSGDDVDSWYHMEFLEDSLLFTYIYLCFISDAVSSSRHVPSNGTMINEYRTEKNAEGKGIGLNLRYYTRGTVL
jgi:hypothetical protein